MGIAFKEIGNLENSIKNFVKAIKINPNYSQAFYNMAIVLKEYGNKESAIDCFKKAIKINPSYIGAYYQLGNIYFENEKKDLAIETYKNLLKIKPDHTRALHLLNALNGETTDSAPNEYVSNLFDTFAKNFENTSVNQWDYNVPSIFERIISIEEKKVVNSIIDLGCITGLVGEKLSKCCNDLVGVDLSKSMLEIAESKNLYKELHHSEISDFFKKNILEYDYFIFADVFIYIGELSNIFRQIKKNSNNVTKLLFSTEHSLNENYQLQPSGRYSHSFNYIKQLTQKYDYKILFHEIINLRKDNNNTIKGGIYLLKYIKT